MARPLRVEYPGAVYHVIQRGNNGELVFERRSDKQYLIDQLYKAAAVYGVEIFAFVIMSNHFHLAIRASTEPLSKVMHRINTSYSVYYNKSKDRSGHVFGGRYKALPVKDDRYMVALIKYIHRNPIRAGICVNVTEYPWSSDRQYRQTTSGFVNTGLLLNMLSEKALRARQKYSLLMEQDEDSNIKKQIYNVDVTIESEFQQKSFSEGRKPLDKILIDTGVNQEDFGLIKSGSRKRRLTAAKVAYAKAAHIEGYSLEEIARLIGVSAVAILKYINSRL